MVKKLAILGSTGSIGQNTLEIVRNHPDKFSVCSLGAGGNVELLLEQAKEFRPNLVGIADAAAAEKAMDGLKALGIECVCGEEGACAVASHPDADMLVSAIVGAAGLLPTLEAISTGKDIALANKETLVMAGDLVNRKVKEANVKLIPVDSEHSAIFQACVGQNQKDIGRLILTASGGPFLYSEPVDLIEVTPEQALDHPRWDMGPKISIDSATMMNKGLEIIEAHWLFGLPPEKIDVVIHPQSIIHSMAEFVDGSVLAQLSVADMKGPISYALSYPDRLPDVLPSLSLTELETLTFMQPDEEKFPSLELAREALRIGGTAPAVLNAANEEAVYAFLRNEIGFTEIFHLVDHVLGRHEISGNPDLEAITQADAWAREKAGEYTRQMP